MSTADRENLTRQIRDSVDIADLVGDYLALKRAGASFKGLCPFHEEKTPSFTISPSRQTFKCFGCGAGGDVFTFVQLKERVDFPEARRILADRAGIPLENEGGRGTDGPGKRDLARANAWAQQVFRRNYQEAAGEKVRQYVADRGITEASAEQFGLGLAVDSFDSLIRQAGQSKVDLKLLEAAGLLKPRRDGGYYDTFRHRLMFPIADVSGRLVGFGGRTMGDDPAKYLNTPATALFDKSASLFGLDRAREAIQRAGRAVLVEGYTDCLMAHQFGIAETVATLGTAMTDAHARILRRHTDRVVLVFDSDAAGQQAADRALAVALTGGLEVTLARVPEGKDPCDYLLSAGKSAFESVLIHGIGALEFRWRQVAEAYDASATGPGRRRAIETYLQQLADWMGRGVIDQIQMGLLLNQLSKILSLPAEDLHRQLKGMIKRSGSRPVSSTSVQRVGDSTIERKVNSGQEALRHVLEMLLNTPEYYAAVAEVFDPAAIQDPAMAAVARELVTRLEAGEPFQLNALIGRFPSPDDARLITDLQVRGEQRGDPAAVVASAVQCLESYRQFQEAAAHAEAIRSERKQKHEQAEAASSVPAREDERLLALAEGVKTPHFSPARARKPFLDR